MTNGEQFYSLFSKAISGKQQFEIICSYLFDSSFQGVFDDVDEYQHTFNQKYEFVNFYYKLSEINFDYIIKNCVIYPLFFNKNIKINIQNNVFYFYLINYLDAKLVSQYQDIYLQETYSYQIDQTTIVRPITTLETINKLLTQQNYKTRNQYPIYVQLQQCGIFTDEQLKQMGIFNNSYPFEIQGSSSSVIVDLKQFGAVGINKNENSSSYLIENNVFKNYYALILKLHDNDIAIGYNYDGYKLNINTSDSSFNNNNSLTIQSYNSSNYSTSSNSVNYDDVYGDYGMIKIRTINGSSSSSLLKCYYKIDSLQDGVLTENSYVIHGNRFSKMKKFGNNQIATEQKNITLPTYLLPNKNIEETKFQPVFKQQYIQVSGSNEGANGQYYLINYFVSPNDRVWKKYDGDYYISYVTNLDQSKQMVISNTSGKIHQLNQSESSVVTIYHKTTASQSLGSINSLNWDNNVKVELKHKYISVKDVKHYSIEERQVGVDLPQMLNYQNIKTTDYNIYTDNHYDFDWICKNQILPAEVYTYDGSDSSQSNNYLDDLNFQQLSKSQRWTLRKYDDDFPVYLQDTIENNYDKINWQQVAKNQDITNQFFDEFKLRNGTTLTDAINEYNSSNSDSIIIPQINKQIRIYNLYLKKNTTENNLTANNSNPNFTVSQSQTYSNYYQAYLAMDGAYNTSAWTSSSSSRSSNSSWWLDQWWGIDFKNKVILDKVFLNHYSSKQVNLKASNDSSSWVDLVENIPYSCSSNISLNSVNQTAYRYYRIYNQWIPNGNASAVTIREIKFDYREKFDSYLFIEQTIGQNDNIPVNINTSSSSNSNSSSVCYYYISNKIYLLNDDDSYIIDYNSSDSSSSSSIQIAKGTMIINLCKEQLIDENIENSTKTYQWILGDFEINYDGDNYYIQDLKQKSYYSSILLDEKDDCIVFPTPKKEVKQIGYYNPYLFDFGNTAKYISNLNYDNVDISNYTNHNYGSSSISLSSEYNGESDTIYGFKCIDKDTYYNKQGYKKQKFSINRNSIFECYTKKAFDTNDFRYKMLFDKNQFVCDNQMYIPISCKKEDVYKLNIQLNKDGTINTNKSYAVINGFKVKSKLDDYLLIDEKLNNDNVSMFTIKTKNYNTNYTLNINNVSSLSSQSISSTSDNIIDWGDGTKQQYYCGQYTHTYNVPGSYNITIHGDQKTIQLQKDYLTQAVKISDSIISLDGFFSEVNSKYTVSSNFTIPNITPLSCKNMFYNSNVTDVNMNMPLEVKNISGMFEGCENLTTVNITFATKTIVSSDSSSSYSSSYKSIHITENGFANFFKDCSKLTNLLGTVFPKEIITDDIQGIVNFSGLFSGCSNLINADNFFQELTINGEYYYNVENLFENCIKLETAPTIGIGDDAKYLWQIEANWMNTETAFSTCSDTLRQQIPWNWGGLLGSNSLSSSSDSSISDEYISSESDNSESSEIENTSSDSDMSNSSIGESSSESDNSGSSNQGQDEDPNTTSSNSGNSDASNSSDNHNSLNVIGYQLTPEGTTPMSINGQYYLQDESATGFDRVWVSGNNQIKSVQYGDGVFEPTINLWVINDIISQKDYTQEYAQPTQVDGWTYNGTDANITVS